jgi:PPE-repeat protein
MIQPPQQPGFTGVVWEAREPDRLARDLGTGPGPLPMAEAGATWTHLATSFGAAAAEYEAIIVSLRGAWQSATSAGVHDRISTLRDWLAGAAQEAAANAAKAEEQAAANELARLTMPNIADIQAIQAAAQMLRQIGVSMGAPVQAIAAVTDHDSEIAKATSARVMRIYEAATEPLATPWVLDQPPQLTAGTALAAEQAGAQAPKLPEPEQMTAAALSSNVDPASFAVAPPTKTAYRAPSFVESATTAEDAEQAVPVSPASSGGSMPASSFSAVAPGAAAAALQSQEHRAGIAVDGADVIGIDNGIVSAPEVLGGSSAPPPPARPGTAQPGAA